MTEAEHVAAKAEYELLRTYLTEPDYTPRQQAIVDKAITILDFETANHERMALMAQVNERMERDREQRAAEMNSGEGI